MKTVILAGGEGKRLRPITEKLPKPLAPIGNIPVIRKILQMLAKHGITEAALTLGYLGNILSERLGSESDGVRITYFSDTSSVGTAGSVLTAREFIGDKPFCVMGGDIVCDIDVSAAESLLYSKNADAVMVLTHADAPGEFGVVLCNEDGRITGFSEKPSMSATYSDTVNAGIYILKPEVLELIPENEPFDFGKDLFPKMLALGKRIYGFTDGGYWCDIGDSEAYYNANMKVTNGESSISPSCDIKDGRDIKSSVIMSNCTVGSGCRITESILCENVRVKDLADIGEGCVIGEGCEIGEGAVLLPGTKLTSGTRIPDGMTMRSGALIKGIASASKLLFGNGIRAPKEEFTVSLAVKLGSALNEASGRGRIGIMHDGNRSSSGIVSGLLRGIRVCGGSSVLLGKGFAAAASYATSRLELSVCAFVHCGDNYISVYLYDKTGLYPKRDFERKLLSALSGDDVISTEAEGKSAECDFVEEYYYPFIADNCNKLGNGIGVKIANDNHPSLILTRALNEKGCAFRENGVKLVLGDDGFSLTAQQDGFSADIWHIRALLLKYLIKDTVSLPVYSPSVLFDLCSGSCFSYSHCPSADEENEARELSLRHPELTHAAVAAVKLIGLLYSTRRSLRELFSGIPSFSFSISQYRTSSPLRFGILTRLGSPDRDGVTAVYARGTVRIIPTADGYSLSSDAASGEYANELIDISKKEIKKLLETDK